MPHLHKSGKCAVCCWVRVYIGVPGNEACDAEPKQPLCSVPMFLVALSAVMFTPLFIALIYPHGKANVLLRGQQICARWRHLCRPSIPPSLPSGRRWHTPSDCSHALDTLPCTAWWAGIPLCWQCCHTFCGTHPSELHTCSGKVRLVYHPQGRLSDIVAEYRLSVSYCLAFISALGFAALI
jgi:hypothetical protein